MAARRSLAARNKCPGHLETCPEAQAELGRSREGSKARPGLAVIVDGYRRDEFGASPA